MKLYSTNLAWKQINKLLPTEFQLTQSNLPKEEFWDWKGNKIHIDRYNNPKSKYRIFLHHGVGTNGRQMNMIFGSKMAELGYEVVAIDNLGYGMTKVNQKNITYSDWIQLFTDFINYETHKNNKEIILFGLSAGGMIAYNTACYLENISGIIGLCFLQNNNKEIGCKTAKTPLYRKVGIPLLKPLLYLPLKQLSIPMKWVSKMDKLTNNKEALSIFLKDKLSAAAKVQIQFLYEYMTYKSLIDPEKFNKCPLLLTQPSEDKWTPLELSMISLKNIKSKLTIKTLDKSGHYPMELVGLNQLIKYSDEFIKNLK